jgi:uncharacterized protein YfeS
MHTKGKPCLYLCSRARQAGKTIAQLKQIILDAKLEGHNNIKIHVEESDCMVQRRELLVACKLAQVQIMLKIGNNNKAYKILQAAIDKARLPH